MAENTIQYQWIVAIQGSLDKMLLDGPDAFVASDLFWYPVEGKPKIRTAPDVMVALGRPRGHRRFYLQWEEGGIPPQVVFEILSPGNRPGEMARKLKFYERYGVEEYYLYDPDRDALTIRLRDGKRLAKRASRDGWVSPLLGIRFDTTAHPLVIYRRNGKPFETILEAQLDRDRVAIERDAIAEERDAIAEQRDAIVEERDAIVEERDAIVEERNAIAEQRDAIVEERDRLIARLRELGIEP